jgi:hypothetical protein
MSVNLNRCMRDKQNLEDSEVHMKIELYISWNISKQKQIIIQTISLISKGKE